MRQRLSYNARVDSDTMSIAELGAAAGVSRRAVRFYVQRGLISPPLGRGRGRHYSQKHLEQLQHIRQLQSAGHSLDAIKRIQRGEAVESAEAVAPRRVRLRSRSTLTASLWSRFQIADGVELHLDAAKHNPDVSDLLAMQQVIRQILAGQAEEVGSGPDNGDS